MASQNVEIVQRALEANERRDVEGLFALLDEDFEVIASDVLPWGGRYKGRDGMLEFLKQFGGHVTAAIDADELVEAGNHVIAIGRATGELNATGDQFAVRLIDVFELRDGKIRSLTIHLETPALLDALAK